MSPNFLKFSISIFSIDCLPGRCPLRYVATLNLTEHFSEESVSISTEGAVLQKTETNYSFSHVAPKRMTDSAQTTASTATVTNTETDASTKTTTFPELILTLTLKECITRKNDWVRANGGDTSFTGAELARRLLSACGIYRAKEAEASCTEIQMETLRENVQTAMAVWICWRTIHASGKLPETALPMEAVEVIFSKVTEEVEEMYNISFEIAI